jgi:hypothetical protein
MAIKQPLPENISHASLNDARKELDEKLNNIRIELDGKIEKKMSTTTFFSILGILVIILLAIFGYFCSQISTIKDEVNNFNARLIVVEQKPHYRSTTNTTPPTTTNPSK